MSPPHFESTDTLTSIEGLPALPVFTLFATVTASPICCIRQ